LWAELFGRRLGSVSSGVTPIVPLVLLSTIACLWAVCHLRRAFFVGTFQSGRWLSRDTRPIMAGLRDIHLHLHNRLKEWVPREWSVRDVAFLVVGGALLVYIVYHWVPTPEGIAVDILFWLLVAFGFLFIAILQIRVRLICSSMREFLRRLDTHPLAKALDSISPRIKPRAASHLLASPQGESDVAIMIEDMNLLGKYAMHDTRLRATMQATAKDLQANYEELLALKHSADFERRGTVERLVFRELSKVAKQLVVRLEDSWNCSDTEREMRTKGPGEWLIYAERIVGTNLAMSLNETFYQIRDLIFFLVCALLLFLWALNSYPLQPSRIISIFCSWLVFWVSASMLIIFAGFSRSAVLSRLSGTAENKVTFDPTFVVSLVLYVVVPLICLLATQFPDLSDTLFKWAGSLQQAFRS
jgi:hypothetical protein